MDSKPLPTSACPPFSWLPNRLLHSEGEFHFVKVCQAVGSETQEYPQDICRSGQRHFVSRHHKEDQKARHLLEAQPGYFCWICSGMVTCSRMAWRCCILPWKVLRGEVLWTVREQEVSLWAGSCKGPPDSQQFSLRDHFLSGLQRGHMQGLYTLSSPPFLRPLCRLVEALGL